MKLTKLQWARALAPVFLGVATGVAAAPNNNALQRFIVFHSWELMSDKEIYPKGSPEGWGCPTISNNAMKEIDPIIQNSEKPLLMWIYNE